MWLGLEDEASHLCREWLKVVETQPSAKVILFMLLPEMFWFANILTSEKKIAGHIFIQFVAFVAVPGSPEVGSYRNLYW